MIGRLVLVCTVLLAAAGSGFAGTISLANPDFDTDATGSFVLDALSGWSPNTVEYGAFNTSTPTGTQQSLTAMSAANVLFLSTVSDGRGGLLDGSVSQVVAVAAIPGGSYTFSIYAAKRKDLIRPMAFELQLYAGMGSAFAVQDYTVSSLSSSSWTQFSVTGVAPDDASGNIGVRLTLVSGGIVLPGANNPDTNKYQVLFDNAGLLGPDASSVPEPMTLSLLGAGLGGFGLLRRRK